jgi:hypothetical protein
MYLVSSDGRMTDKLQKGLGRKRSWPERSAIITFASRQITRVPAEIRTKHLPNASPACSFPFCCLTSLTISRICVFGDRMVNEYRYGGMRIGRGN